MIPLFYINFINNINIQKTTLHSHVVSFGKIDQNFFRSLPSFILTLLNAIIKECTLQGTKPPQCGDLQVLLLILFDKIRVVSCTNREVKR